MEIKKVINKIIAKYPDVLSIYIYGSYGTEYETKTSDLDLAILPISQTDKVERWNLAQEIAIEMDRDVDLIDLLDASTVLRYQILTTGIRIYCRDERESDRIESTYLFMYLRFNEERSEILKDYQEK